MRYLGGGWDNEKEITCDDTCGLGHSYYPEFYLLHFQRSVVIVVG